MGLNRPGWADGIGGQGEGEGGGFPIVGATGWPSKRQSPSLRQFLTPPIVEKENFPGLPLPDAAKTSNISRIFEKK